VVQEPSEGLLGAVPEMKGKPSHRCWPRGDTIGGVGSRVLTPNDHETISDTSKTLSKKLGDLKTSEPQDRRRRDDLGV
jgi:hypothetical protein